ncbi:uncharacterized protein LOC142974197, partial [Anticarsia gemmatalis]|uniref:uncharacterized protein LOC142974197 n=1 Tax=Anticarsia gemmatalis TaxID=129554 RepID=UPI003F75C8FA
LPCCAAAADSRVLAALRRRYLQQHVLAPRWAPAPLTHPLPAATELQDYIVAFDNLPNIDTPALLALPANCRVAWEKDTATDIISRLKELNSTVSARNKVDGITPLKSLLSLWKKLMSGSPFIKGEYQPEKVCAGWWWSVCDSEARDAARAARAVHVALAARAHLHAAPIHHANEEWQMLWSGPEEADAYVRELGERARAALNRLTMTNPLPDYMPTEVDLRSFVRPSRVVWALRVRTAARLACPINSLVLSVKWDSKDVQTDGMVVVGLRLAGAEWRGALAPAGPAAPPHVPAPPLVLRYVLQQGDSGVLSESSVVVPLYMSAARAAQVLEARAPLAPHWDVHSAALHAPALLLAPHHAHWYVHRCWRRARRTGTCTAPRCTRPHCCWRRTTRTGTYTGAGGARAALGRAQRRAARARTAAGAAPRALVRTQVLEARAPHWDVHSAALHAPALLLAPHHAHWYVHRCWRRARRWRRTGTCTAPRCTRPHCCWRRTTRTGTYTGAGGARAALGRAQRRATRARTAAGAAPRALVRTQVLEARAPHWDVHSAALHAPALLLAPHHAHWYVHRCWRRARRTGTCTAPRCTRPHCCWRRTTRTGTYTGAGGARAAGAALGRAQRRAARARTAAGAAPRALRYVSFPAVY